MGSIDDLEAEAEAVISGLSGRMTQRCDCGVEHSFSTRAKNRERTDCPCGRRHNQKTVCCQCGSTFAYGPKAGWRVVARQHHTWKEREARFLARIAEFEAESVVEGLAYRPIDSQVDLKTVYDKALLKKLTKSLWPADDIEHAD